MIRTITLAALATTLALPAIAADDTSAIGVTTAHASELANGAAAEQAKRILAAKGYVNVAISGQDDDGRWTGTALKDGKTIFVSVELPKAAPVVMN